MICLGTQLQNIIVKETGKYASWTIRGSMVLWKFSLIKLCIFSVSFTGTDDRVGYAQSARSTFQIPTRSIIYFASNNVNIFILS